MRRYAIARYLTPEQIARAAAETYIATINANHCERWCRDHLTEYVPSTRTEGGRCPLGVALDDGRDVPSPDHVEAVLSNGISSRGNARRYAAIQRFIHDVDCGKIGPDDVASALGVTAGTPRP